MKISIVVVNYNYVGFLAQAVDSALEQTWPDKEVVVVDNGSIDDSWRLIESYGNQVIPVRNFPNRGVGAGYNAGFERASGDWVMFLDADDILDVDALAACVECIRPDVAKVQFRMRHLDRNGRLMNGVVPYLMHDGDVRPVIRRFGHYAGPPGSGNLYRREAIARYFPLPVQSWWLGADTVPFALSAFHGQVASVPRIVGSYRLHLTDRQTRGVLGNNKLTLAEAYLYDEQIRTRVLELLRAKSGIDVPGPFTPMPTTIRKRALSWRLRPDEHPHRDDTPARLLDLHREALDAWPGYRWVDKAAQMVWMLGLLYAPRPLALRFADGNTASSVRGLMRAWTAERPHRPRPQVPRG